MRISFGGAAVAMSILLAGSSAGATRIDDPEKFVRDIYMKIEKAPDQTREPEDIYTRRLADLFALEAKDAHGEVGRIDFDPWTDAQESRISRLKVSSMPVENGPDRRTVFASFVNEGRPLVMHFYFERTKEGWKLDDIRNVGKDGWTLSLILKYGWEDIK